MHHPGQRHICRCSLHPLPKHACISHIPAHNLCPLAPPPCSSAPVADISTELAKIAYADIEEASLFLCFEGKQAQVLGMKRPTLPMPTLRR